MDHVALQGSLQLVEVEGPLLRLPLPCVHLFKQRALGAKEELLQGGHERDGVLEREAVLIAFAIEHHLYQCWNLLAQDLCGTLVRSIHLTRRLQAPEEKARFLHKVAIRHVAQPRPVNPVLAVLVLRQGKPDGTEGRADGRRGKVVALRGTPTAEHSAHGLLEVIATCLQVDGVALRAGFFSEEALPVGHGAKDERKHEEQH
mmetsp:Transcript_106297/g.226970  ORF Transcript_106297/g.226970 Transcript_106297/m.226970 type:complete len:202 (+) Transcript_106297:736-1341(+)